MEITQEERMKVLDQIAIDLGFVERELDEFTASELMEKFHTVNLRQFIKAENIKHTRRKAVADGRRQFVYKIIIDKSDKEAL